MKKLIFLLLITTGASAQIAQSYKTCDSILLRSATSGSYLWSTGQTTRQIVVPRGSGYIEINVSGAIFSETVLWDVPVGTPQITGNQLGVTLYDAINLPNPYYPHNYVWQFKTASTTWSNVGTGQYFTPLIQGQYRVKVSTQGCSKLSNKITLK